MDEKLQLLTNTDIFNGLGPKELAIVAEYSSLQKYSSGDTIFKEGALSDGIYIIKEGDVLITKNHGTEDEVDLAHFISGESFGEMDYLENKPMTATATAHNDTELLIFPGSDTNMETILAGNPEISAGIMHKLLAMVANRIRRTNTLISEKSEWIQDLKSQLFRDKLTGLYNRTFLEDDFARLLPQYGEKTVMIMIKPDNFKPINDTYGHEAGDKALKIIAEGLKKLLRENDIAIRYRGDEYAAVLPDTDLSEGIKKAEEFRSVLSSISLEDILEGNSFDLTFSLGVASYPHHGTDNKSLTQSTFETMFRARDSGGDTVFSADD